MSTSSLALAAGPEDKSNSSFRMRQGDLTGGAGDAARAHARAGDCAGALDLFEQAINVRGPLEPTLYRDRGACHDKLNQPYPAIEDYRTYLANRPDAPDADQIRGRLGALEQSVGISKEDNKGDPPSVADTPAQRNALEKLLDDERAADAAATSPIRRASGFVLGAYVGVRTFFGGGSNAPQVTSFFDSHSTDDLAYQVGISGRYSTGSYFDILAEAGVVSTGKVGEDSAYSGPGFLLAGQLRLPVGKNASDQLLIALGPGYERYSSKLTATRSMILGIGRIGYRHVFGENLGLEIVGYGGAAHVTFVDAPASVYINDADYGIIGLQINGIIGF